MGHDADGFSRRELLARGGALGASAYLVGLFGTAAASAATTLTSTELSTLTTLKTATQSAGGAGTQSTAATSAAVSKTFDGLEPPVQAAVSKAIAFINDTVPGGLSSITPAQVTTFMNKVITASGPLPTAASTFATAQDPAYVGFSAARPVSGPAPAAVVEKSSARRAAVTQETLDGDETLVFIVFTILDVLDLPASVGAGSSPTNPPVFQNWSPTLLQAVATWAAA